MLMQLNKQALFYFDSVFDFYSYKNGIPKNVVALFVFEIQAKTHTVQ